MTSTRLILSPPPPPKFRRFLPLKRLRRHFQQAQRVVIFRKNLPLFSFFFLLQSELLEKGFLPFLRFWVRFEGKFSLIRFCELNFRIFFRIFKIFQKIFLNAVQRRKKFGNFITHHHILLTLTFPRISPRTPLLNPFRSHKHVLKFTLLPLRMLDLEGERWKFHF